MLKVLKHRFFRFLSETALTIYSKIIQYEYTFTCLQVKTVMQTNYHYEWLPSQSLVWYKKHVKKLDKDTKVSTIN